MKQYLFAILTIVLAIIVVLGLCALSACVFWGLGVLIVKVFKINYDWTFWHGLCVALVVSIISGIFNK